MRTLGIIAVWILVIIGGLALWWEISFPTYIYRYRLSIAVDVDGETKTASSVIEVRAREQPKIGEGPALHVSALGQAVFVDLGGRGNVIATLSFGPNGSEHKLERLVLLAFRPTHPSLTYKNAPQFTGSAPLTGDLIPTLVTFTDLNDPKTARVVRPDMFEQEFGPGVRFRRATLEMVPAGTWPFTWIGWPRSLAGEPVTRGIEKKLPWWGKPLPWIRATGQNTGIDTRPFVPGEYRLMSEQFRRSL